MRPPPHRPFSHPLAPLTGDEIIAAREIVFASGRAEAPDEALRFAYVGLCDPPKELVRAVDRGEDGDAGPPHPPRASCRAPRPTWPR